MSSVYRPICLSHNPALELDHIEWQSGHNGRDILTDALAAPVGCDGAVSAGSHRRRRCEAVTAHPLWSPNRDSNPASPPPRAVCLKPCGLSLPRALGRPLPLAGHR